MTTQHFTDAGICDSCGDWAFMSEVGRCRRCLDRAPEPSSAPGLDEATAAAIERRWHRRKAGRLEPFAISSLFED